MGVNTRNNLNLLNCHFYVDETLFTYVTRIFESIIQQRSATLVYVYILKFVLESHAVNSRTWIGLEEFGQVYNTPDMESTVVCLKLTNL